MSYIKKEPLLQIAKELQGNDAFDAPLIVRAIEEAPEEDAIEVVRCKDCKYCFLYSRPNYERYECEYYGTSDEIVDYVEPMHYCSYGERRVEDDS